MEKGKAPAKGYYRGSSSNANPRATTNEHDVVDDRANAVCIDLTNDTEEATEVGIHRHFSIRGYVAEIRRNNPLFCSLFPTGNDGTNNSVQQLPPLDVPRFRWWRCDHCVYGITGSVDASANASEDHGARDNNVNEPDNDIETKCPSVEASLGHGAPTNNVKENDNNIETKCPVEGKLHTSAIIILDDDEDERVCQENINAPKTSDDVQDSVETCAPSRDGKNIVPSNAALDERGTDRRASIEKFTLGGCRNKQARRKSRKIRTLIDLLSSCERQLLNEVSAPDQNINEASASVPANDSSVHEAAQATLPPSVRRRRTKAPRNKRKIRDFDLNLPAEPEDGSEEEEPLRSSNAEPLPPMIMAAGNPIPAQGTHLPINGGLTPDAAPVLIQRPLEPSPSLNPGRTSAFRRYQRSEPASPFVAGSSNQHSNAEDSSSRASGARAGSSRGETEDCQINRNPADFSVVGPRNPYMIGSEDPKRRKKISRAEKGKRKLDEAG